MTVAGGADLAHETPDEVEVIDYKTDRSGRAREEYRKQLGVYYHVLDAWHPEWAVPASILWTENRELDRVDPLPIDALGELACRHR